MIQRNLIKIRKDISEACSRLDRQAQEIKIVAVSKGRSVEEIKKAVAAGITDIGENKVQEAFLKYRELTTNNCQLKTVKWHMVGHLQSNKAKDAVGIFELIHSVDSVALANELNRAAGKINKIQNILIQVNVSGEKTKFGMSADELTETIKKIAGLKNIRIEGLMTIAPMVDDPEKARPYFRKLKELKDMINAELITQDRLRVLSMGMTDDFQVAIEEGSNMIRIGRAIYDG